MCMCMHECVHGRGLCTSVSACRDTESPRGSTLGGPSSTGLVLQNLQVSHRDEVNAFVASASWTTATGALIPFLCHRLEYQQEKVQAR